MPDLPELFTAQAISDSDPFTFATEQAEAGCDAGLLCFDPNSKNVNAALVLAPEVPLTDAMVMIPLCAVAYYDATTNLVGLEDDVKLDWNGALRIGSDLRGQVRIATPGHDSDVVPDWIVIGLSANMGLREGALFPDPFEGVAPNYLLELWAKKIFDEISHWSEKGAKRLRRRWTELSREVGHDVTLCGKSGILSKVNTSFEAMIEGADGKIVPVPMTTMLVPTEGR